MIREDLKKLKDLKWKIWNVRDEIKDKDIKNRLGKLLYEIISIIEKRERELIFKMLEEYEEELEQEGLEQGVIGKERGVKIDKRGLKVIRRNLGKNIINKKHEKELI